MSISVIDFGAKGDQATDNSTVLQALIDSLPDSEEMKTIYFPSGFYGLGSTLKVNKSNLIFDGPGILYSLGTGTANRSLLQFNTYTGTDLTTHRFQNIIVRNIGFDMRVAYTRDPIIWDPEWDIDYGMEVGALSFMGIDNVTLENVRIYKTVHSGLNVFGCYNVRIDNVTVDMLKSYTMPGGVIRGGNAINLCTYGWGSSGSITNGRIGNYRISHCHIYGSEDWLPAIGTNDVTDQCNIGIMIETGSSNYLEHQIEPVIVSGCTVERCYWGIIAEGMKQGGSGDVLVTNNAIKECFTGAGLYPDMTGELGHNSFNFIFTHNKISQIYTYALDCKGENILIGNNIIRDWGLLKKTDPGSSLQNTTACAIIVEPKYPGNNTTGVFHNLKIYDNIFEISAPHDDNYASGVGGIWIDNRADTNTTFRDVIISDNILNGGKSTYSSGIRESGIFIWGAVQNVTIHHNTITGFPRQAILAIPFETNGVARAVSQMRITENVMYDLCWGPGVNEAAMTIVSGNTDFEFSDNKVFQIEGSNLTMILSIPQINNVDSPLSYLTIRNNTARNLKYGDTVVFSLKISGSSVIIENNSGWNYGAAAPSDTSQYRFKGELVHNTNPSELGSSGAKYVVSGWKCIAKGKPGSWVQQRILTGN